ncbi:diaminopimelate epimerase [Parapedobacter lycopersici]|uniref:diaminopimelate epimerase n=1 Tax=Parapedobacter lycopersici TaxID=1864939 RepID=UPI00333F214A
MAAYPFYKYQGAGNDFILFDNRTGFFDRNNEALVRQLCDRRFGIGGDGLMLLQSIDGYDFEMVYFNADGGEGSMCGNGGRCIVAFARDIRLIDSEADFLAADGRHHARIAGNGLIHLKMTDVDKIEQQAGAYVLNTGSPHYVQEVNDLAAFPVVAEGQKIRYNDTFRAQGINVNFVQPEGAGYFVRTYERGVEDETLACGTGATAVALAMAYKTGKSGDTQTPIRVAGGQLNIQFRRQGDEFSEVYLVGPAQFVFKGEVAW